MQAKKRPVKGKPPTEGFCSEYVNPRTGKVMRAADYGYKAWKFGPRKSKPKSK